MEVLNNIPREPRCGKSGGDLLDDGRCLWRGFQDDRIPSENSRDQAVDKSEVRVLEMHLVSIDIDQYDQPRGSVYSNSRSKET